MLKATSGSRIVTISSNGYQAAVIDFDNLKSEVNYDPMREYRQSKLANLMFSIELQRRIMAKGDEVLSIAAQPGANKTELTRHLGEEAIAAGKERLGEFMDPWQGALSSLYGQSQTKPAEVIYMNRTMGDTEVIQHWQLLKKMHWIEQLQISFGI